MNIESIRETFVPPIVAMIITMGLVSDWTSAEPAGSAVRPDISATTAKRSLQTGSQITKMGYSGMESVDATLLRLVYRLPGLTGQHDRQAQILIRYENGPTRTWWM